MSSKSEEKQPYFTSKRKGTAALICVGAVVLWAILWLIFPMEFYSLFFASLIGNNLLLVMLAVIITFPFNFIFTKALNADIPVAPSLAANIICMVAFIYAYSVSGLVKYPWQWILWLSLAILVHVIAMAVIFAKSKPIRIPKIKNEKKPLRSAILGAVSAVLSDSVFFLMFRLLLSIFRE